MVSDALQAKIEALKAKLPAPAPQEQGLPPVVNSDDFHQSKIVTPPEILKGLLSQGSRMIMGGPSKSRKSWEALSLAYAVAAGLKWLIWETSPVRVLYINLELRDHVIHKRSRVLREHKEIKASPNLDFWNLRSYATTVEDMVNSILMSLEKRKVEGHPPYGLIILDPLYKMLGDRDENSAGDMTDLVSYLEKLAFHSSAAVVVTAHFPKGSMGGRSSMDRISGSGVFGRDADCILTFTPPEKQEDEKCPKFAVDLTVRDFPPVDSFTVRWDYPSFTLDDTDPSVLVPRRKNGRPEKYTTVELFELVPKDGISRLEWMKRADEELGVPKTTFLRRFKEWQGNDQLVYNADTDTYITKTANHSALSGAINNLGKVLGKKHVPKIQKDSADCSNN
jgi:hypothetical protein